VGEKLENQTTQKPKKRGRPPKREQNQPASSNREEFLQNSSTIKVITQGITKLSENLAKFQENTNKAIEVIQERVNKTEQNITQLAQAVSTITEEFVNFTNSLKQTSSPGEKSSDSNNNNNSSSLPSPVTTGDKLMYWGNLLARLAELGRPSSPPPPSSTEEGLGKGFDMMVGAFTKLLQIQSAFRKNFLEELRDTFTLFPKVLKGSKTEGSKIKSEEESHLGE